MKTNHESAFCPDRIAELFEGCSVDDLFTLSCTISQMIEKRLAKLKNDARTASKNGIDIEKAIHSPEMDAIIAGRSAIAIDATASPHTRANWKAHVRGFADLDAVQIEAAVAVLQRMASDKRKLSKAVDTILVKALDPWAAFDDIAFVPKKPKAVA